MMSGGQSSRLRPMVGGSRAEEGTIRQSVVVFTEVIRRTNPSSSSSTCVSTSVASMVLRLLGPRSGPASILGRSDNNRASRIRNHWMLRQRLLRWMMRMVMVIGVVQSFVHA